ncbi:MAG TPA: hypothetical protein DCZ91_20190, partial [Lachnospiraceae bacterium]|nr:hypothetical protein [Lachnospiraceae bacterium]
MVRKRKRYRKRKNDFVLYVFTIALCVFTVIVLLSGGEKNGEHGNGAVANAGEGSGTAAQTADGQEAAGTVAQPQDIATGQSMNAGAGSESSADISAINGTGEKSGTG